MLKSGNPESVVSRYRFMRFSFAVFAGVLWSILLVSVPLTPLGLLGAKDYAETVATLLFGAMALTFLAAGSGGMARRGVVYFGGRRRVREIHRGAYYAIRVMIYGAVLLVLDLIFIFDPSVGLAVALSVAVVVTALFLSTFL